MYFVYVIRSGDGKVYTGQTNDLKKRIARHETGHGGRYTRRGQNYKLIHSEKFQTRAEAVRREKALKSGQGRQWLKNKLLLQS